MCSRQGTPRTCPPYTALTPVLYGRYPWSYKNRLRVLSNERRLYLVYQLCHDGLGNGIIDVLLLHDIEVRDHEILDVLHLHNLASRRLVTDLDNIGCLHSQRYH